MVVRYWLCVMTYENYKKCLESNVWGTKDQYEKILKHVKINDKFLIYVKRLQLGGICRVSREYFYSTEVIWEDDIYPHRINFVSEILLPEPVSVKRYYYEKFPDRSPQGYFRKGFREIPEDEFKIFYKFIQNQSPIKYFILQTGSDKYKDEPETRYHFKEGIPGYLKLKNSQNRAKFVYYQKGIFYGKGSIGDITSYNEGGDIYYYAQIKNYEKIKPVEFKDIVNKLSITSIGQAGIREISSDDYEIIVSTSEAHFRLTEEDFRACRRSTEKNYIESVHRKFKELLEPELLSALGEPFTDFQKAKPHRSPYVARMWTLSDGGRYRDHMWLGMAHRKYENPREGIQLQFGINRDSVFSFGIWMEKDVPKEEKEAIQDLLQNRGQPFLELTRKLDDSFDISIGDESWEANKLSRDDLIKLAGLVDSGEDFSIKRGLSREEAIEMRTSIVEHISDTFNELLPLYNFLARIEVDGGGEIHLPQLSENMRIICYHLIAGKNVVLIGAPGTGKTRMAKKAAILFCGKGNYDIRTANAEWSAYNVVGGEVISGEERLGTDFRRGFLSRAAEMRANGPHWVIIDELNRANLDLAFGEAFTLLDIEHRDKPLVKKEDYPWASSIEENIWLAPTFRLIATMNSYDRAVLFSLGYAFRRRFAFVEIPSPYVPPINVEYDIEAAKERWRDRAEQRSRAYESVSDEISRWLKEDVDSRKIHPPQFRYSGFEEALQGVWSNIKDETVWSPSAVLDSLAKWMTDKKVVDMGYAQTVDSIKFALVYLAYEGLTPENTMKAVDNAFLAYMMPQLEYFLPKVRREKIMSGTEEGEGRKKLDELLGILESLSLIESHAKLKYILEQFDKYGDASVF